MHGGRKSERRYGVAMNGNKPRRNLGEEDRTLCCSCHAQCDEAFIYGRNQMLSMSPLLVTFSRRRLPGLLLTMVLLWASQVGLAAGTH